LDFRAACEWLNGGGDLPTGNAPATANGALPGELRVRNRELSIVHCALSIEHCAFVDTWLPYLLPVERLHVATDAAAAGDRAAAC
jgi:hypothetical protein